MEAENNYTAAVLAPTEELQDALYEEMKARIPPEETYPAQVWPGANGQADSLRQRISAVDGDQRAAGPTPALSNACSNTMASGTTTTGWQAGSTQSMQGGAMSLLSSSAA